MRVRVPKFAKLNVHQYEVEYRPNLWIEEALRGCANHITQKIQIEPAIAKSQKDVTFLHEVIHIIDRQYELKLSEDDVSRIAEGVADLLFTNLGIELDWSDIGGE